MIDFREATAEDRDAILALRRRCFPHEDIEKQDPRFWDWEFGRGRMFVAEAEGRPVAHLGFVPQTLVVGDARLRSMLAVDAMTDPAFRRQQLFTRVAAFAREALRTSLDCSTAFQIRGHVLQPMTANGWTPALATWLLVRPLSPRTPRAFEEVSAPVDATIAESLLAPYVHVEREPAWRFAASPRWKYAIDADGDAYVVTRRASLRGHDTLAVVDVAWRRGRVSAARALLRRALARGRAAGIRLAATLVSGAHPALPFFVKSGFMPSPYRFRLLVNVFDARAAAALQDARWALTWADTDHL
ncbi:MAG: GNAT family N-acetyltransferase [Acidobacteria bacterium]|nr:GNAT family N-acetyltransferase [Acidobacteriota bacterium]MBV9478766.1 GNAT family N-acetyltransferase [Acidobacteriota bacterium]